VAEWFPRGTETAAAEIEIRGRKIPLPIVQILQNRGYDTTEKIEQYFTPSLARLYDPFSITDMEKAVDRILKALHDREKISVHGDYDTDGITGTALVVNNLKKLGIDVEYYIPHRLIEGYGLSVSGIERALKNKCTIIITIDCGITAVREVTYAQRRGIDVIVCDHHQPKVTLPQGFALVNPKIAGCNYPFKELAGVGVAFKMLQALFEKLKIPKEEMYKELDLVALGSVVDIVPLINENRILVKYGLKKIMQSDKVGFQALLRETGLMGALTSYHLGFIIGPRINACGRLRDAKEALELFLTEDMTEAAKLARALSDDNTIRKEIEETMYLEARLLIEKTGGDKGRVIVLGKETWHEGVVGIVASRISRDYYKPTVLLALKKDIAKGSARSIEGFNIVEAFDACNEVLTEYGGHSQAAGLEMRREQLSELQRCINEYAEKFDDTMFTEKNIYDIKLNLDEITNETVYFLKFFEPTGTANPPPVFLGENFEVVGVPRVVGNSHLKFSLRYNNTVFDAIAFDQAENILDIEVGKTRIDCLYSVSEDSFTGKKKVVLKIRDMKKVSG
jgi:single-stranded-DNA-specific exonuclease